MSEILYREARQEDLISLASIRAANWETREYWYNRISGYFNYTHNPQKALKPRVMYVAVQEEVIIGFIAGHLTTRYECEGELEWIDVLKEYRRSGIATELIGILREWFLLQKAHKICVDPGNEIARKLYKKNGADNLNDHWMFWKDIGTIRR
jgi:ribosomal protein S18 acetylase RimI-like enzyme